jgi:hypothetical protein
MSYIVIKTGILSNITDVRFYEETKHHIEAEHPEVQVYLPSILYAIVNTIAYPTHVEESYGGSYVYVNAETTNASGDPLRVPVKPVEGTSARVRTAYFATTEGPSNIVWRRR